MDIILPDVGVARVAPRLIDVSGRFASPLSGSVRTITRPGDRWGMRLDYTSLRGLDRARLESFIAQQRGAANRALIAPRDWKQRGTMPSGEMLANNDWGSGTLSWTTGTATTFTAVDGVARVQSTSTTAPFITSSLITLVVGRTYTVRVVAMPGNVNTWKLAGGTTSGASDVFNYTPATLDQIGTITFTATSANFYLSLLCNTSVAGKYVFFSYASVTCSATVNGAGQTGSSLLLSGLPVSVVNLAQPGDWIGVGMELKRVTAALSGDGSGAGTVHFSPPLRTSPANLAAVTFGSPLGRFITSATEVGWQSEPGYFATLAIDFVEAA